MSSQTTTATTTGNGNADPISDRKRAANRANARKSTGPRTPQGKSRSALNALTHGLRARLSPDTLVPQHERQDFAALAAALHDELHPQTPLQQILADCIALLLWKQRRTAQAEAKLLDDQVSPRRNNALEENTRAQRRHARALARHQADPDHHPAPSEPKLLPLPTAADAQAELARSPARHNPWLTLHHYDQATGRELHKTLKQYLALQAARDQEDQDQEDEAEDPDPNPTPAPNEPTGDHEISDPQTSNPQAANADTSNPPSSQSANTLRQSPNPLTRAERTHQGPSNSNPPISNSRFPPSEPGHGHPV